MFIVDEGLDERFRDIISRVRFDDAITDKEFEKRLVDHMIGFPGVAKLLFDCDPPLFSVGENLLKYRYGEAEEIKRYRYSYLDKLKWFALNMLHIVSKKNKFCCAAEFKEWLRNLDFSEIYINGLIETLVAYFVN